MDAVRAKSILENVANQYKAAKDLAEALEIAVSGERRALEFRANLEHLSKEQTLQQSRLDQMVADTEHLAIEGRKVHAAEMASLQAERKALSDKLEADRRTAASELAAKQDFYVRFVAESDAEMARLTSEKQAVAEDLIRIQDQIVSLKVKAQQLFS